VTEWNPLTKARKTNAPNEVHHGQRVAGANATGVDAIVGKYEGLMAGPPSCLVRLAIARFRLHTGPEFYVSIFFR
jgi:hypothetical protein